MSAASESGAGVLYGQRAKELLQELKGIETLPAYNVCAPCCRSTMGTSVDAGRFFLFNDERSTLSGVMNWRPSFVSASHVSLHGP